MTTNESATGTKEWLTQTVKPLVDERIAETLDDAYSTEKLKYQIETGGKRIRPGVTLLVAQITGLDREIALDVACGAELVHTFSLVHDDVIDRDRLRRGDPTFWSEYGIDEAINIGNLLYTNGLLQVPDQIIGDLCETVEEMATGVQMEFEFEDRRDVSVDEYLQMVEYKTGSLFSFCVSAPVTLSDRSLDVSGLQWIGPAFQIRDDLLDLEAGKGRERIGNDVRAGRRSILAVHADDEQVYDILDKPFEETTEADVQTVMKVYKTEGSLEFATKTMERFAEQTANTIDQLPDGEAADRLADLRSFAVDRNQ